MADRATLERFTRELMDQGKLIEAGWVALRLAAVPLNAPAEQLDSMRMAFMSGAQHLFASIMTGMEPGEEPTDNDNRRMELIDRELEAFGEELKLRFAKPGGKG